ncbi:unnamed protein product [Dracunculus medinensis]|uniref:Acetyl-coenzyme A transporter 1 n=1 Tax=Dracunculus medinensis TaxID=318479 RepID=A0A0N4UR68_DRAME|nr:unnamed protein product [Dracunculus medinensis]
MDFCVGVDVSLSLTFVDDIRRLRFCFDKINRQQRKKFFFFWGIVFIITTTLVLIFKKEVDHSACQRSGSTSSDDDELELGVFDTYILLWDIVRLKPMLWMIVILLTGKVAFGATDGMTGLKLIAMGMPKDKLSSMAVFLTPVQVLLPWFIGKWTAGSGPLNVFLLAYPYRIFMGGIFAALVWWTPSFRTERDFSFILYVLWIVAYCFHQVASYSMFVSMMAFNAQVSDPKIGGTYMTLLNTLNNLGGNWPVTLVLSLADYLSYYICFTKGSKSSLYSCNAKVLSDQCKSSGNVCEVVIDGYYVAVALCSVIGIIWFKAFFNKIKCLQKIPRTDWRVFSK